jgi:hypothetical protein
MLRIYVQGGYSLDESTPNRRIAFIASSMYILEPLDRFAYAATAPIKGRNTNIASLPVPLTICGSVDAQLGEAREVHDKGKEKVREVYDKGCSAVRKQTDLVEFHSTCSFHLYD